jgi:hypothetical protein
VEATTYGVHPHHARAWIWHDKQVSLTHVMPRTTPHCAPASRKFSNKGALRTGGCDTPVWTRQFARDDRAE